VKKLIIDGHAHIGRHMHGTLPFPAGADDLFKEMKACGVGIDKAVIAGPIGQAYDYSELNDMVVEAVKKYPDTFVGYARVNPWFKGAVDDLARCHKLGLIGLKLHPMFSSFYPNDPVVYPLIEKAHELGVVVQIHTGLSYYALPSFVLDLAERFPDVTFIMAHCGREQFVAETITSSALRLKNVIWDLTAMHDFGWILRVLQAVDKRRIIMGSDWPFYGLRMTMKALWDDLGISDEDRRLILGQNIARILHL
jgi:predicted TIM-barrel fold metal-dependent hydrolase